MAMLLSDEEITKRPSLAIPWRTSPNLDCLYTCSIELWRNSKSIDGTKQRGTVQLSCANIVRTRKRCGEEQKLEGRYLVLLEMLKNSLEQREVRGLDQPNLKKCAQ